MMFASWLGLTAFRRMNGVANTSRQRKKGRTILHLEVLEDRWVPSTATGTSVGDIAGNLQSQSYLLNSPTINSAQTQNTINPQILSSNVSPNASSVTAIFTPSGSSLPSATEFVSYSTDITAAPSMGSSKLSVGIDPASEQLLNSIGLTAVVTPATESTAGKLTIQGIPTDNGIFSVTVVAYREPTEPLGTKTYTLEIAPNSVDVAHITASVSPTTVDAGNSVSVSANVTDSTNSSNIIDGGTVTFTLTGASGTSIRSNPITVASGNASATLTIPSTEPTGGFNLTASYSGVSGTYTPVSTTINNALTVNNTGVSILGNITPTSLTASTVDQSVTANAIVEDNNAPVVGGTVTFNLLDSSGTQVTGGTATGVTDNTGLASVALPVPANTPAATYTVQASYTDASGGVHTATVGTLVINAVEAAASVTLSPVAPITASASDQTVNLSATVTQSGGQGSLGSVQFQVLNGTTVINSATAAVGSNGVATAAVTIPGGTPAGTYGVVATFTGRGETTATATGTLTVNAPPSPPATPSTSSFIESVYEHLLGRPVDPDGLAHWTNVLNALGNTEGARSLVVADIEASAENRFAVVNQLYEQYLHRSANGDAGAMTWVNLLGNGWTNEQVAAFIVTSQEFIQNQTDGSFSSWLNALYEDAFHRPVDANGLATWSILFAGGTSTQMIAMNIFQSVEYSSELVDSYYTQFLNRSSAGDPGSLGWVSLLQQGIPDQTVIAQIIGSQEFYNQSA